MLDRVAVGRCAPFFRVGGVEGIEGFRRVCAAVGLGWPLPASRPTREVAGGAGST
jgi:hypothetical protein